MMFSHLEDLITVKEFLIQILVLMNEDKNILAAHEIGRLKQLIMSRKYDLEHDETKGE